MSEASEKVTGLRHLPIFPLPLVLLPNELLPLHIFEPRYRQMLKDVGLERNLFGISFFSQEGTLAEKPPLDSIGCVAEIREIQALPDGRSNILTVGVIRYRLLEYVESGDPYLVGDVEFFEDDPVESAVINPLADEVFRLFKRVAKAAHKLSDQRGTFPEIPQAEPEALSFLVTAAFNLEPDLKYKMIETRSTSERLEKLREILLQTVDKMEESANIHKISQSNGHTKKKIDF